MVELRMVRVLAWLIRNEQVTPSAIERAVNSAIDMQVGEEISLTGPDHQLRRAFVNEQIARLHRET